MKKIIFILLLCGAAFSSFSQTLSKKEKIQKLLDITGSAKIGMQAIQNMIPMFEKSYSTVNKEFWDDFAKEIKPTDLTDLIIPIYDKYYTEDDIDQLIAFYNTPVGKKMVEVLPSISKESMAAGQAWGQELAEKVLQELKTKGYIKE